jgi:hypothetical protein
MNNLCTLLGNIFTYLAICDEHILHKNIVLEHMLKVKFEHISCRVGLPHITVTVCKLKSKETWNI